MTSNDSRRLDSTLSMSRAGRRWGTAATVMLCFWSGGARSGPVFAAACAFATPFAPPVHLSSAASSSFPLRILARRREHCLGNARHARLANRQRWHVAMGASCGGDDTAPSAGRAPMPKQIAGGKRDRLRQNIEYILLGRPGGLRQALRQKIVEHRSLHLYVRAEQGSRGQDPTQTPVEPGEETGSAAVLGTGACSSSEITPGQALVGLLENMTGVDLDGDGHVGRPSERRNARPATLASAASSRVGSLRELEARAGKFSERSRVVQAPLEACFAAAADVDRYQEWCHHGLKKLLVLERDDGTLLAKTIKMDVGKFGIRAVSTLEMDYPAPHGSQIRFTCTKGEAIPRIDATYSFVPEPGSPTATRITYQLGLCFAFAIPDLICDNFVDTIVTTALEMLETRILCLEGHHPPPPPPGKRGTGFVWRVEPFDAKAFKVRLRECARLEQLGANGMIEDVASHALAKSVEVPASLDKCFQLAADLDGYMAWCQGSGMQSLEVLERYPDGRAQRVLLRAGSFSLPPPPPLLLCVLCASFAGHCCIGLCVFVCVLCACVPACVFCICVRRCYSDA